MTARRPPLRSCTPGGIVAGLAVGLMLMALAVGCGGDDEVSDDERSRLEASLSFLTADFQFSADQVGCVREQLEARVPADQLEGLDEQLRGVDAGIVAIDDLPGDEGEAVTASIATCAVAG